jgi:hypothetical protein
MGSPEDKDLARKMAGLLWKSRRVMTDVARGPAAERAHEKFVQKRLKQMKQDNLNASTLWKGPRLLAAVVRDKSFGKWVGLEKHQTLNIAVDLDSTRARAWICETLEQIKKDEVGTQFRLVLPGTQMKLKERLERQGWRLEDSYLVGDTPVALRKLSTHLAQKSGLEIPEGLEICELSSANEIRQIIALKRKVFRRQPEYCWFGSYKKYLKSEQKELEDFLKLPKKARSKKAKVLLLRNQKGKVLGFGSVFFYKADRLFRRVGGLDYCFDASLQGKGLGSQVFLELLKAMRSQRVPLFTGYTSNPAIKRLGAITQRRLEQVFLTNRPAP